MTTEAGVSTGRRVKAMELVVSDVIVETPDTVTLVYARHRTRSTTGPDSF